MSHHIYSIIYVNYKLSKFKTSHFYDNKRIKESRSVMGKMVVDIIHINILIRKRQVD